jgi:hypothetical protein
MLGSGVRRNLRSNFLATNRRLKDTKLKGRPDMVAITYKLVLDSQAEAVFIISNPKLTRRVVYGMESRGIAAYGAIFDS